MPMAVMRVRPRIERVKAATLLLDYNLYPRQILEETHIQELIDALEAEVDFPPPVADRASRRVIDGFHRISAYLRYFGPETDIDVEWRDYPDDASAFADAMRLNAGHGQNLRVEDRARCLTLGRAFGLHVEQIAEALNLTPQRLRALRPVKLNGAPPEWRQQTPTGHEKSTGLRFGGMRPLYYVEQVITLLEKRLVDPGDGRLGERLDVLHGLLEERERTQEGGAS